MKNILIFGEGSYIGEAVKKWLMKTAGEYTVSTMSSRNVSVANTDFSPYQVVYYVAGVAH